MRHENYANCASGTAHNDGDKILEAVRAQQREEPQEVKYTQDDLDEETESLCQELHECETEIAQREDEIQDLKAQIEELEAQLEVIG